LFKSALRCWVFLARL